MSIENMYLIYDSDFKRRSVLDWILSHIMGAPPPHRYHGCISFHHDSFEFYGNDTMEKETVSFTVEKSCITQLYYGYDRIFSTFQTRGMGLTWAPIRFTLVDLENDPDERYLYLVYGTNDLNQGNQALFEELKSWLS